MAHLYPLTKLSDQQLLADLSSLVADKRAADATLLAHIAEVDRRKLYAAEGYDSMFAYCTQVLHLSEAGAYNRIAVARAARQFPLMFDKLAAGEIHHAGLRLLAPRLTADNHRALLDAATHKTKRQIEVLLAERFPQPDVATTVRALPRRTPKPAPRSTAAPALFAARPSPAAAPPPPKPPAVEPLAPRRYRVELTVDEDVKHKLDRAKDLLRHRSPHVDEAEVLDRALDVLIEQRDVWHLSRDRPATRAPGAIMDQLTAGGLASGRALGWNRKFSKRTFLRALVVRVRSHWATTSSAASCAALSGVSQMGAQCAHEEMGGHCPGGDRAGIGRRPRRDGVVETQ